MARRPTIKDVARKAGLSLSTVSLALNDRGYVSSDTKERVVRIARELSYHPTRSAKGLASKTSGNIGFIVSEEHFSNAEPFYTRIFLGTEFEARTQNYYILLTTIGNAFSLKSSIPRFLLERNVDGVIVAGKVNEKYIDYIDSLGIPVVLVDYELKRKRFSSVLIDNLNGVHAAMSHVLELGHKEIGFIGGDIAHPSIAERYTGYKESLSEWGIGLNEELVVVDEPGTGIENGCHAMEKLLAREAKPSALLAANDAMAIGCLQCAKQKGVRVPGDLAIVGFDDIEMSSHVEPRLTTVRVFKEEMGKLAVQQMVGVLSSKTESIVTVHVPVELVVRESTGVHSLD